MRFVYLISLIGAAGLAATAQQAPAERTGATRVSWRTRTLVGNDRLMQWKTGPAAAAFAQLTFSMPSRARTRWGWIRSRDRARSK